MQETLKRPFLLLFTAWLAVPLSALDLPPRPAGPVADYAHAINASDRSDIVLIARALWEQAGFGLAVATFPGLEGEDLEDFANRLYEKWGIGAKGRDEGALLLLSLDPRRVRIEAGYGAEGYLNDAKAGRLLDQYGLPYFKAGDFSAGLLALSGAIASVVAQEKNLRLSLPAPSMHSQRFHSGRGLGLGQLLTLILVVLLLSGTRLGRAMLLGMLFSGMLGGGRGGRGGFGGGFGSGGFGGGFGGGLSGGGGASRGF